MSTMISGALGRFKLALASAGGPLLVAYMANGIGAVLRTVFDKLMETISVKDFGAKSDGVTDDSAAIVKANTRAGKRPLVFIGVSHIAAPTTITAPIADTLEQIFSTTSQVTIDNGRPVRPEWFGATAGNIRRAVNALPVGGGVVSLSDAVYPPSYDSATGDMFNGRGGTPGVDYMVKKHVRIQGARLPEYADDNRSLINGTIIRGTFYVASEASGFQADAIGVDVGANVVADLYGGGHHDGFCVLQVNKSMPVYGANIHIGRVRGLCGGPTSLAHACLFEAIDGGSIEFAEGRMANHGVVIKSKNLVIGSLVGRMNHGEDVIFKSDDYANLANIQVANVLSIGAEGVGVGRGVVIEAVGAHGNGIQIANISIERKEKGVVIESRGGMVVGDISLGSVTVQNSATGYSLIGGPLRVRAENLRVNASTVAVFVDASTVSRSNSIGRLEVANANDGLYIGGKLAMDSAFFDGVTKYAVEFYNTTARVKFGDYGLQGTPNFWNIEPVLDGDWKQHEGGNSFVVLPKKGAIEISGLIRAGTSNLITVLPLQARPPQPVRTVCAAWDGAQYRTVELLIAPDGNVYVSSFAAAGAIGYISLVATWPVPF